MTVIVVFGHQFLFKYLKKLLAFPEANHSYLKSTKMKKKKKKS